MIGQCYRQKGRLGRKNPQLFVRSLTLHTKGALKRLTRKDFPGSSPLVQARTNSSGSQTSFGAVRCIPPSAIPSCPKSGTMSVKL